MEPEMTEAVNSKPICCGCKCAPKESHTPGERAGLSCKWSFADWLGAIKVRLDIGRMDYKAAPGLYAAGNPDADSPVLVTANYKLSLDLLRRAIDEIDAWILVLDTKGVNVWCAAGKGTFGTEELVAKIESCGLDRIVRHKTLVLPQLGAVGVAAHEVRRRCGFNVVLWPREMLRHQGLSQSRNESPMKR
jgi:CO dehydrogenase/acetyl-CoA synthase gamma subunit (corrinoid Fe-S protein)